MVSTSDSDSGNPSSIPGTTLLLLVCKGEKDLFFVVERRNLCEEKGRWERSLGTCPSTLIFLFFIIFLHQYFLPTTDIRWTQHVVQTICQGVRFLWVVMNTSLSRAHGVLYTIWCRACRNKVMYETLVGRKQLPHVQRINTKEIITITFGASDLISLT
jgi:hypothetical protein